jgi:hypothetical protein
MKNKFLKLRINQYDYDKFQIVCDNKGKTMSEVLRSFIESYSNSENVILLDINTETLKSSFNLCREKKVRFNDLINYLLDKAIKNKDKLDLTS